jgi:ABC-2 type transport system permease protein
MKMLLVARKTLLEWLREVQLLGLTLALPLAFTLIYSFAYGTSPKLATYKVLVYDPTQQGAAMVEKLRAEKYPDGRPAFVLSPVDDLSKTNELLKSQAAAVLLVFAKNAGGQLEVKINGDATSLQYIIASTNLGKLLEPELEALQGKKNIIQYEEHSIGLAAGLTEFDTYAPGMMIFAILMLVPQTAMLLGREIRTGNLRRLRLTALNPLELLGGISLSQMVVAVLQILVLFVSLTLVGYHYQGSLGLALLIGLLLSFSSIGFGLIVSCFVQDDSQALNIGSVVSMLQVFLSGAWFQMSPVNLFTVAGYTVNLYDFIPATHSMSALQLVLTSGAALSDVWLRMVLTFVLSAFYFGLGVLIFGKMQMKWK